MMQSRPRQALMHALAATTMLTATCLVAGGARAAGTDAIAGRLREMVPGIDDAARPGVSPRAPAVPAPAREAAARSAPKASLTLVPDDGDDSPLFRKQAQPVRKDAAGRLMVAIRLEPSSDHEAARANVVALGGRLASEQRVFPKFFTAFLPVEQVAAYARKTGGVRSITLPAQAHTNVGLVTPPSLRVLKADLVQQLGYKGDGITIGVLSDSFDLARNDTANPPLTNADQDVKNGDLPGPGNPNGYTQPVLVLDEQQANVSTDEGRAMLQIIHDVAPGARLCFASAFNGEDAFAANILNLADPTQGCGADIIVDDVGYSDEGVYSDTEVSQAVNAVANQGVSYFSSAGNGNQSSYNGIFTPVPDKVARAGIALDNLKLDQVPAQYTAGGFHNFGAPYGVVDIAKAVQSRATPDGLYLQWDDPFLRNAMTANYTLLVFDADGNFLAAADPNDPSPAFSGTGYGIDIDEPYQEGAIPNGIDANGNQYARILQYAVARADTNTGGASHFRVFDFQAQYFQLDYTQLFTPAIFGHPGATGAIAVAAEYVRDTAAIEYFSSPGVVTTYLDGLTGNRLARPQVRNKPDIAAPDGTATSFFYGPPTKDGGGFPTFFGTSAAAPHAAAVGALLLDAAGGPGSLSPDRMREVLQASGGFHALDHGQLTLQLARGNKLVTLTVEGFTPEVTPAGNNQFRVAYNTGGKSVALTSLTINARNTGTNQVGRSTEQFSLGFYVGATENVDPASVTSDATTKLADGVTVKFAGNGFLPGGKVNFGIDFDQSTLGNTGITPALLDGAEVTAVFSDGTRIQNRLTSRKGFGYDKYDGYGLIDAAAALSFIPQAVAQGRGQDGHPLAPVRTQPAAALEE